MNYTHTHEYTHTRIPEYTCAYIHAHTRASARGLGVSQRAPLIRVPASRSHNLRPTSPPARHVGPVCASRRRPRILCIYIRARAHRVYAAANYYASFFPSPPPLPHLHTDCVRFSKRILRPSGLKDVCLPTRPSGQKQHRRL